MWCLEINIHITAQHFPGTQNTVPSQMHSHSRDRQDRLETESHKIQGIFGPLEVDLYVLPVCPVPMLLQLEARSIRKSDRCTLQVWTHIKGYVNTPWNLFAKWHHWCSKRSSDLFYGPIAQVANTFIQGRVPIQFHKCLLLCNFLST